MPDVIIWFSVFIALRTIASTILYYDQPTGCNIIINKRSKRSKQRCNGPNEQNIDKGMSDGDNVIDSLRISHLSSPRRYNTAYYYSSRKYRARLVTSTSWIDF